MTDEELMLLQEQMVHYILHDVAKRYGMSLAVFHSGETMEVIGKRGENLPSEMILDLMNPIIERRDLLVSPYPKVKLIKPHVYRIKIAKRENRIQAP